MQCPSWIANDTGRPKKDAQYKSLWSSKVAPICVFGLNGSNGPTGPTGQNGVPGFFGITGVQGPFGKPGGPTGSTGSEGLVGPIGMTGSGGLVGFTGPTGQVGFTGVGSIGSIGPTGLFNTIVGATGAEGLTGQGGWAGSIGSTGPTGIIALSSDVGYVTQPPNPSWFWENQPVTINHLSGVITLASRNLIGPFLYPWLFEVYNSTVTENSVILLTVLTSNHDVVLFPTVNSVSNGVFQVQVTLYYGNIQVTDVDKIYFTVENP